MTVGIAQEIIEGRTSHRTSQGEREYTRRYLVETTNRFDGALGVAHAPLLPRKFFQYTTETEYDINAFVYDISAEPKDGDDKTWIATVKYTTDRGKLDPENPLTAAPKIRITRKTIRVPVPGDAGPPPSQASGPKGFVKGPVNTAGDIFDPIPEMDSTRFEIVITRNEGTIDRTAFFDFQDAINESPWEDFPARTCKMNISAEREHMRSIFYWVVSYHIEINQATWDIVRLSAGLNYLDGGPNGDRKSFLDDDGKRYIGLLDNLGDRLDKISGPRDPVFVRIKPYYARDFNVLNLPPLSLFAPNSEEDTIRTQTPSHPAVEAN